MRLESQTLTLCDFVSKSVEFRQATGVARLRLLPESEGFFRVQPKQVRIVSSLLIVCRLDRETVVRLCSLGFVCVLGFQERAFDLMSRSATGLRGY